jgi:S1-C subfamily serine protease
MQKRTFFLLLIIFFSCLINPQYLFTQVLNPENNYARNSPGTVMIQAVFSATTYVNRVEINQNRFDKLVDSVKKLDTSGKILTQGDKLDIVVRALYKSPFRFFSSGNEYFRQLHRVVSTGTGFLITDDGYVITNCHIIDRDSAYIRNKFILSTFDEVTQSNINALQSAWAMTLTEDQRDLLYNAYGLIYSQVSSMILFDLKKEFFVLYRSDSAKHTTAIKKDAKVIIKGKAMPGKDIAILKMDGVRNLPTLMISNDSLPRIGTEVMVLGYPEPVTTNSFLAKEANIEPSLTSGIVSAIKQSIFGWPVIQMDAVISHGSSGSPVCNDKGEVIGIATFGSFDQGGGSLASGFNFAIPVAVMNDYLDSAAVKVKKGKATELFNLALDNFYQQFYRKALEKFEKVNDLNSNYPQLSFYLQECRDKIAGGDDRNAPPRKYVFWIMVVIAVLTSGYIFYKMRKKGRRSR